MKNLLLPAICIFSITSYAGKGHIIAERKILIRNLNKNSNFFMKAAAGVSSGQVQLKAAPGRCSIPESMELIAVKPLLSPNKG